MVWSDMLHIDMIYFMLLSVRGVNSARAGGERPAMSAEHKIAAGHIPEPSPFTAFCPHHPILVTILPILLHCSYLLGSTWSLGRQSVDR